MWICASRNRPHLVQRMFSKVTPIEKGVIVIDDDQTDLYANLTLPPNWSVLATPRGFNVQKFNDAFARFPNEPWYGKIDDDMLPETAGWDSILPKAAGAWGFAWADDVLYGRAVCCAFGGDLVRALGFISCPAVKHFYGDDGHELAALELGIGIDRTDVKVHHLHFTAQKSERDETYANRPSSSEDAQAFAIWKRDAWPAIRDRVRASMPALTVACVLKHGGIYDWRWVEQLNAQVARHLRRPHRFVCLSDVMVPCELVTLKHDWPGWWSKIELFELEGATLFFDLDTAIVGNLSEIAARCFDHDFVVLRDFYNLQSGMGSGVIGWSSAGNAVCRSLYREFVRDPSGHMARFARGGDQAFMRETLGNETPSKWQDIVRNQIVSYKLHCRAGIPDNARVVCLHGQPKFSAMRLNDPVRVAWEAVS